MKKLIFSILILILCLTSFELISCGGEDDTTTTEPPADYSITYELNGGTNSMENPSGYNAGDTITLGYPEKADYMFAGWFTDSALTTEIKEIKGTENNLTLYAKWVPLDEVLEFRKIDDKYYHVSDFDRDLETVIIPSSYKGLPVIGIAFSSLESVHSVKSLYIPETLTYFCELAVLNNRTLEYIGVHPDNPTYKSIDGVLYSKDGKTIVRYPPGRKNSSFDIPSGVESIHQYAFYECKNLVQISIPQGVTSIGEGAFHQCTYLESIEIPNSVTVIKVGAFSECRSLKSITLSKNIESIEGSTFYNCYSLEGIIIPNGVKTIKSEAFIKCSSLKNVIIPDSVTSLEGYAFSYCDSLETVVIPKEVIKAEYYAFSYCPKLTLYCEAEEKPEGWDGKWSRDINKVVWGHKEVNSEE